VTGPSRSPRPGQCRTWPLGSGWPVVVTGRFTGRGDRVALAAPPVVIVALLGRKVLVVLVVLACIWSGPACAG